MAASRRASERNGIRVWHVLAVLAAVLDFSYASIYDCPKKDSDAGFNATNYSVTVTDNFVSPTPGYLVESGVNFTDPETTGVPVSGGNIEVTLYCAKVEGASCDGQNVTINNGIAAGLNNWSYCLGCAGDVVPEITGLGAYNETYFSTCQLCSCNETGHPFREGIGPSFGRWNSTGNCSLDPITGSGACNCSQYDGTVITPLGPYVSYGNCSGCNCSANGTAFTPETFWNISGPNDNYFPTYSNFDDPLCFLANCTCDENGTVSASIPVTYNVTGPNALYYPTIDVLDGQYCYLDNCTCDSFGTVNGSYTTTYNETMLNASLYYVSIEVLDQQYCYFDNCSCDPQGNLTTRYTTTYNVTKSNPSVYYTTIGYLDQYCYLANCTCDPDGNSTGAYTTTYNVTKVNASAYFATIAVLDNQYCYLDNCSCDASGNSIRSYTTTYNVTQSEPNLYYPTISYLNQYCHLDNCTCDSNGSAMTSYTTTKDTVTGPNSTYYASWVTKHDNCSALNCTCNGDGTVDTTVANYDSLCECQCHTCTSNATCSCDPFGNSTTNDTALTVGRSSDPSAVCGCGCQDVTYDCGCGCGFCGDENTCTCNSLGNSSTSPNNVSYDGSLATCGCGCVAWEHDCGCNCSSCDTAAACSCDGANSSTTPSDNGYNNALATCGCQCDPWEHDCGCGCSSCDTAANCSCDLFGNSSTSPDASSGLNGAADQCGCQCDPWVHDCGCQCNSCETKSNCSCDDFGNSSTFPNTALDLSLATCGCQCDPWIHDCGCGCESCETKSNCSCDDSGNSSTFPNTQYDGSLATCGCGCDKWEHDCGCECPSCANNATCECDQTNGSSSTVPSLATDYCGCGCIAHICECDCIRDSCDCQCEQECGCNCTRNECGYDSPDGKNFTPTGGDGPGGSCKVSANCYDAGQTSGHPGFYAGGLFTSYSGTITASLVKYVSGVASTFTSDYLYGYLVTPVSAVASFPNLAVKAAATIDNAFTLYFSAVSEFFKTNETASFQSIPDDFKVFQANTSSETSSENIPGSIYQVSEGKVELGNFTLKFYGSQGALITNATELDGFNVSLILVTGEGGDSSNTTSYDDGTYSTVDPADFYVVDKSSNAEAADDVVGINGDSAQIDFSLAVYGHVGYNFQVVAIVNRITTTQSRVIGNFRIDPGHMTVSFGQDYAQTFGSGLAPKVVRVNGEANATDVDGLPGPLRLQLEDDMGNVMTKSTCTNCAQIRLLQCTDSFAASASYPTCASSAQAYCAATDGSKCTASDQFLDTLSGTTTASVVNGTAEFTDIQLAYVLGAGYKLQFTLNPGRSGTTEAFTVTSPHANGEIQVPDDSYSVAGVNNSFFVRPYELEVSQDPAGDGVDNNMDGVPDAVAIGVPFRVQPAVEVKGDGYYFDRDWNKHGFAPVTAIISSTACAGDCTVNGLSMTGTITGVSTHGKTYTATTGSLPAINYISGNASTVDVVDLYYDTTLKGVGQLWRDLQIDTASSYTGQEDVVLEFRCGPNNINVTDTYWYTSVTGDLFDVMGGPDPPVNLRVSNYDNLGFRIEFDPAPILRTKPLSGYIIEIDECKTGVPYSCQSIANPYYSAAYGINTILGSDLTRGGGFAEEILVDYSDVAAGEPMEINMTLTPSRSLYAGDSLVLFMGAPNVLFANFSSTCALSGDDAALVTHSVDATTSQLTLTVASGSNLIARKPVFLQIPLSCNALMPGGAGAEARYGSNVSYSLPHVITAPVIGEASSTRFDNCKLSNASTGCTASQTFVLPTIQDGSSMDFEWSGQLQYGATGAACRSDVLAGNVSSTGTFPSNRFCSLDAPNSNDPDALDSVSGGNSGDNGSPIGSNPGRSGSGGAVTTGTVFPDGNDACRDGTATKNPCALTIGQDWQIGVNLSLIEHPTVSSAFGSVTVQFSRPRALGIGDQVKIPLVGLEYVQPDPVFPCVTFVEGIAANSSNSSATASVATRIVENCTTVNSTNTTTNLTTSVTTCVNVTVNNTDDYLQCELLSAVGYQNSDVQLAGWSISIDVARSVLNLVVGSNVPPMAVIMFTVGGFTATQSASVPVLPDEALAEVIRGSHMTIILKSGAIRSTYSSVAGDPIASYAQGRPGNPPTAPGLITFTAGNVYTFRVYAYNGRFKSEAAETLVQNRAITPPAAPAYYSEESQEAVGAAFFFSNLAANQKSLDAGTKVTPTIPAAAGQETRVGIFFTPARDVGAGQTITFELPGFTGPDYLLLGEGTDIPIYDNIYEVYGNSSECACSATGTISTPSKTYYVTRDATGSGACNYTSPNMTGMAANATEDIPWCACSDCACSLAGVVSTPTPLYNVTGNCSDCDCTAAGVVIDPPTIYNISGNCSSCACSDAGVSSFDTADNLKQDWTSGCAGCTCDGIGNATCSGGDDPACTCSYQACNCECIPRVCECGCPLFRECTCGCPVQDVFECGCYQNTTHPLVTQAIWSGYSKSIVIVVSQGTFLPRDVPVEMWIPKDAGITFPATGGAPIGNTGGVGGLGHVNAYKLNWASAFPSASQPREGFLIQMTTDIFWRTDVQTVMVPENLDRGVVRTRPLTHLTVDVTATDLYITVADEYKFLRGQFLKIQNEYIFVKNVNATILEVRRGQFRTTAAPHLIATGTAASGSCGCADNSTTVGGGSCVCNTVYIAFIGATDPSVNGGIDTATGALSGTSCTIGGTAIEGCNPSGFNFLTQGVGLRTFQSAFLEGRVTPQVRYATACGGTFSSCTSNCLCTRTTPFAGYEFGNNGMLPKGNNITIASPGDVFAYPLEYKTTLALAADALVDSLSLAVVDATGLSNKYIRVNDEIMFVERITRGVLDVVTYQSFGGTGCSCTIQGTAVGPEPPCSCVGDKGVNCTEAGVLSATGGGGGKGFLGNFNFTASDGSFATIEVTSPGYSFTSTPTIFISAGGTGCLNVNLKPVLSSNVLKVTRGALGTTRAEHAFGSSVSAVLWPSQTRQSTPGLRYNFRIAAFNSAGISPFLYPQMKLLEVFPRTLPAAGNVPMEVILIGGGVTAANYTLYIGYTNAVGNVDLGRAKKCTSLVVRDVLGTRMTCQSPSWVGARHSLILHFQSGTQEQIAVGNNWIRFEPPTLTMVQPAQLDAGLPVNITITGRNFGKNSSVVTGRMQGATPIPCTPVRVVTDLKAICTLIPRTGDVLTGDIILTVGNTWSGGGQSTRASPQSKVKEKPAPVSVEATLPIDVATIPEGSPERITFVNSFLLDVANALGISRTRLQLDSIRPGSIIITFIILADPNSVSAPSPAALAVNLAAQAADPTSALRQGTVTSIITVTLPPGTEALAAAEAATAATVVTDGDVALWESSCVPKSYTAFDMEICYDCCTYVCEIGAQVPQVGGQDVLPGYRAQTCQGLCLVHCGYSRPIVLGV